MLQPEPDPTVESAIPASFGAPLDPDPEPAPEPDVAPEPELAPEPDEDPDPELDPEVNPELEPDPELEPESDPEPEPALDPELEIGEVLDFGPSPGSAAHANPSEAVARRNAMEDRARGRGMFIVSTVAPGTQG
ncbi:MAG: hypothetical protein M3O36_06120 [Myxococcota bacterium]|nr:hypothetical protein [Myxococcota bacterium]